jgi:hypothetical protein
VFGHRHLGRMYGLEGGMLEWILCGMRGSWHRRDLLGLVGYDSKGGR